MYSLSLMKVTLLVFADDGEVCLQESARGHLWPVRPWREWDNESGGVQLVQHPDEWWGGRRWWVGGGGGYVGYSSSWKNIDSLLLCLIITIYKSTFTGNEDFDFLLLMWLGILSRACTCVNFSFAHLLIKLSN